MVEDAWSTFDGWAVSQGFDPRELEGDRLLSAAYYWATKDGDQESIKKFDTKLYMPPKGVAATEGPWSPEAETNAFNAFKSSISG